MAEPSDASVAPAPSEVSPAPADASDAPAPASASVVPAPSSASGALPPSDASVASDPDGAAAEPDPLERALVSAAPRYALSHWLLRRGIGLSAVVAWISLAVQETSLFGPEGIFPMDLRVERMLELEGTASAMAGAPSLFYLVGGGPGALDLVTGLGLCSALALTFGFCPAPSALVSYAAYLSFVSLGTPFLPLQWDTLLCESLVLCAVISPWRRALDRPSRAPEPVRASVLVAWLLPSRLMFASGLVKILGGDPTWADGTAMAYHYWTQPLPSPLAPFAHAAPPAFHSLETLATLVLEIGLPLLVFAGRRARAVSAAGTAFLMALIALTGSFGFFNLLTVALVVALVDDGTLGAAWDRLRGPRFAPLPVPATPIATPSLATRRAKTGAAAALFALGTLELLSSLGVSAIFPGPLVAVTDALGPFRVTNGYGLFARMTTSRDELVFLATEDGEHWEEYDFRYKPGDPRRPPRWCTPHLPRFDWMLWFAALGEREDSPWVARIERGLREGRPAIRALFSHEPFDGRRPRAVRIERRSYRFGDETPWERGPPAPW